MYKKNSGPGDNTAATVLIKRKRNLAQNVQHKTQQP